MLRIIKDAFKSFEAFVVLKCLTLTILFKSHSLQGHANTNKTYSWIRRHFLWKGTCKGTYNFIQYHDICRQHNRQRSHTVTSTWNQFQDHLTYRLISNRTLPPKFQVKDILMCKHVCTTFGGNLTLITDKKRIQKWIIQKGASELGI